MSQKERKSLQFQYAFFSSILVILIVIVILYSRSDSSERYQALAKHRNQASTILTQTTELRDQINTITNAIDIVMLEPEFKDQINLVFSASFNEINVIIRDIESNRLIVGINENNQLETLSNNIGLLYKYSLTLFDIRSNIYKQYPSMAVSETEILPARDSIDNIFSISINEADEESINQSNIVAYELLIDTERLWGNVVSTYRLYLANKFGAINDNDLVGQEQNVTLLLDNMNVFADKIAIRLDKDEYPFEATEQLLTLSLQLQKWEEGFSKVVKIHHSDVWRADASFMRNTILPLVNEVINNLKVFDKFIHVKNELYVKKMAQVSEQQSFYLIIITLIFVAYSLMVFSFLRRMIFKPLAKFSGYIRSQAFSLDEAELMKLANTKETLLLINSFIDMHHQSIARRNELLYQAMHDSLTGLPNRKSLMVSLDQNIKLSNRDDKHLSFLMLDLNKFKDVNDTLGHHIGDELLIKVGERIKSLLREVDLVARLGGDEFSIVLPGTEKKDAALVAAKINQSLKQSFTVLDYSLQVGVSIGIAEYPSDGESSNVLMQHADVAMYDCKHNNTEYSFYDLDKDSHSLERLAFAQDLKLAIENKTIDVYYQPKCAVMDKKPIGSEALLRWSHPDAGFISPEYVIELAESSGIIDDLTFLIINKALSAQKNLKQAGHDLKMAINLSVHNLNNDVFVDDVENIIDFHGVDAQDITFEITENAMMENPEKSISMMNKLTQLGVKLSVDDYGTGFSSLAYLKKLPVSELKIDRSFVNDITFDQSDKVIVQSTIELGHNLGLSVVAEGVEDEKSLIILQQLGCDVTQGYYFSKPLPYEQYVKWLEKQQ